MVLAPGAIANCTYVGVALHVRLDTICLLPPRRAISVSRTVTVASALPVQTPPSPSQASTSEIAPRPMRTDRLLATPGRVGAATRPAGSDGEAGGALASACAHPLTQDEIASTRVK